MRKSALPSADGSTLVGDSFHWCPVDSPLLVGGAPWRLLSQTANDVAPGQSRLVVMYHRLPRCQVKALHLDFVLSVRWHVLTSQRPASTRNSGVIWIRHACSASRLPAAARTDASVMCGATCYALPDPHRLATTSLPRLHLVECAQLPSSPSHRSSVRCLAVLSIT